MATTFVRGTAVRLVCLVTLALVGCGDDPAGPSDSGSVSVDDFAFNPDNVVVAAGATVTWTWTGSVDHNVNFASPSISDSPLQTTGMFSTTMPSTPGTYTYQCDEHPVAMNGVIVVQ